MSSKKQLFWSSDKLLSLAAILISVCTFVVFLYQTHLIREQQYMSVYPYLSMGNYGSQTKDYRFVLENKGIGPAIIQSINVKSSNGTRFRDIAPFVLKQLAENDSINFFHANLTPGRLISSNELIEIIGTSDDKVKTSQILYETLNNKDIVIEIIYKSIYGKKWKISLKNDSPIEI